MTIYKGARTGMYHNIMSGHASDASLRPVNIIEDTDHDCPVPGGCGVRIHVHDCGIPDCDLDSHWVYDDTASINIMTNNTKTETTMQTTETKSNEKTARIQNWTQDEPRCQHGMPSYETANAARELTINTLTKDFGKKWNEKFQVKVRKYPLNAPAHRNPTFSVLVFKKHEPKKDGAK